MRKILVQRECKNSLTNYFNGLSTAQLEDVRKAHDSFLDKLERTDGSGKYASYRIREGMRKDSLAQILAREAVHLMFNQYLKLPED